MAISIALTHCRARLPKSASLHYQRNICSEPMYKQTTEIASVLGKSFWGRGAGVRAGCRQVHTCHRSSGADYCACELGCAGAHHAPTLATLHQLLCGIHWNPWPHGVAGHRKSRRRPPRYQLLSTPLNRYTQLVKLLRRQQGASAHNPVYRESCIDHPQKTVLGLALKTDMYHDLTSNACM